MQIFLVGGAVRDKLMGRNPKDFDYSCVLQPGSYRDPFQEMVTELTDRGFKIFLETPEHFTVRAKFPKGHVNERLTADFVLARREGTYTDGRRPDHVSQGTLHDDLARRDFTMNAIAMDESGSIQDPFGGAADIQARIIRAVGDPRKRMAEDALRILRALRFHVTLGFRIDANLQWVMLQPSRLREVSDERKMEELNKMFKHDALMTLKALETYSTIRRDVFEGGVNLMATMKQKGFN